MDGNGRVGRFLMNTMMASGGYPWTIIPVTDRNAYASALEKASVGEDKAILDLQGVAPGAGAADFKGFKAHG